MNASTETPTVTEKQIAEALTLIAAGNHAAVSAESAVVRASVASRTARQVRADGREQGWTAQQGGGRLIDLCPNCTTKRQDGAQQ